MGHKLTTENGINTLAILSARYSHQRKTGATVAVIRALRSGLWQEMSLDGKTQLLKETRESSWCKDDWEAFKIWAKENM